MRTRGPTSSTDDQRVLPPRRHWSGELPVLTDRAGLPSQPGSTQQHSAGNKGRSPSTWGPGSGVSESVRVYIPLRMSSHGYTYTRTCIWIYTLMCVFASTHILVDSHINTHTVNVFAHTHICTYVYICICVCANMFCLKVKGSVRAFAGGSGQTLARAPCQSLGYPSRERSGQRCSTSQAGKLRSETLGWSHYVTQVEDTGCDPPTCQSPKPYGEGQLRYSRPLPGLPSHLRLAPEPVPPPPRLSTVRSTREGLLPGRLLRVSQGTLHLFPLS